ncbi:ankyrin repeat domain-containing protein [Candidatus Micrarchaeota archaeon]|nr:ankyrin repeat domain-containing protein [Candidatus Micrarchaeota archaeon]
MSQENPLPMKRALKQEPCMVPCRNAARARAVAASWGAFLPPLAEAMKEGKGAESVAYSGRSTIDIRASWVSELAPKPKTGNLISETFIRGPKLEVFISKKQGATMEEALARADAEKRVIASNKRLSKALVGSDEWRSISEVFPCWTGTMVAYEEPGRAFGRFVEYTDNRTGIRYVFTVPDQFIRVKNGLLVAEHPDFKLEKDGNDLVVRAARVELIERLPANEGWYLADPAHGIPFGGEVDNSNPDARYLSRIDKRVGLVARGYDYYDGCDYRRVVYLVNAPSDAFGVAVEAPEGGVASVAKPPPLPRKARPALAPVPKVKLSEVEQEKLDAELLEAVKKGDTKVAEELIARGADTELKFANTDWTALMHAAVKGYIETTEMLIAKGADVNAQAFSGWTALMQAAFRGNISIAEMLIAKNAGVNAKNDKGKTALDIAIQFNNTEIAEMLKKHMEL